MTLTYKTDDSFFILVLPPFTYYGYVVKNWFTNHGIAKFRYIKDIEIEREFCNLEMIDTVYPGIKTVGIIFNPWARMLHGYNVLCAMKKNKDTCYDAYEYYHMKNSSQIIYKAHIIVAC